MLLQSLRVGVVQQVCQVRNFLEFLAKIMESKDKKRDWLRIDRPACFVRELLLVRSDTTRRAVTFFVRQGGCSRPFQFQRR